MKNRLKGRLEPSQRDLIRAGRLVNRKLTTPRKPRKTLFQALSKTSLIFDLRLPASRAKAVCGLEQRAENLVPALCSNLYSPCLFISCVSDA